MNDPNQCFDGLPAFPFADVQKSMSGTEAMNRTQGKPPQRAGPSRTGRPKKATEPTGKSVKLKAGTVLLLQLPDNKTARIKLLTDTLVGPA